MAIKIITDSASEILPNEHPNITVLPMHISFDDEEYLDGIDLTHEAFYEKLIERDTLPKTAQISPFSFTEAIEAAVADGSEVLLITIASKLSGTYQSASIAAAEYDGVVSVIDSETATVGEKALVYYAQRLISQGLSLKEITDKLNECKSRIRIIALLDTLEYLKKGGRISAAAATVGDMLSIKPVVALTKGELSVLGKAHGSKNGHNLLIRHTETFGVDFTKPLFLGYTGLSDKLIQKYIKDSHTLWEEHMTASELPVTSVGATIGTHIGPGGIAVAFFAIRDI